MKRWFRHGIENASLILSILGVGLGLIGYLINHYVPDRYEFEVWLVITSILIFNGVMLGRVIKSLALDATIDSLTGLGNKGLFYYLMKSELQKYKRKTQFDGSMYIFSLAMVDIDDFKRLNDSYGHLAGDHVLKEMAHILEQNARSSDGIVRWGGEEFAFVLPGTEYEGAFSFLERIREIIANYDFGPGIQSQKVTVSVGVVSSNNLEQLEVDNEEEVINDIVQRADKALYHAKEKKNCVVGYS